MTVRTFSHKNVKDPNFGINNFPELPGIKDRPLYLQHCTKTVTIVIRIMLHYFIEKNNLIGFISIFIFRDLNCHPDPDPPPTQTCSVSLPPTGPVQ